MRKIFAFLTILPVILVIAYPTTIKVLISRELSPWGGSRGYDFDVVEIVSNRSFKLVCDGSETVFPMNKKLTLKPKGSKIEIGDVTCTNVILKPLSRRNLFEISNIERKLGKPRYPGKLIVSNHDEKLYVVNEVPIEDYVVRVVPSEMPSYFPKESLKAQAVLARSLAVLRAMRPIKRFSKYGADVDDSVSTQVYNNISFTQKVKDAVDETKGVVVVYGGEIVDTMVYFSTSAGFTANVEEVWSHGLEFPGKKIPYLRAQPQFEGMEVPNLRDEAEADWFFRSWDWFFVEFYDSISPWFRWKVTLTRKQLENIISKTLPHREKADRILKADFIKVVEGMDPSDKNFSVGELLDLRVLRRGEGGNVMTLEIVGTNGIWRVDKEYNIRFVIRPRKDFANSREDIVLHLYNGKVINNYSILPSAFFTMDIDRDENGRITAVTFYGGGNGHGVGLSQYGARYLGERGRNYEDIVKKFYYGVELKKVY